MRHFNFDISKRGGTSYFHSLKNLLLLSFALLSLTACERKGKIIQESAPPNPLIASKAPELGGHLLASHRDIFYKSAQITVPQANKILGGFTYKAHAIYKMTRKGKQLVLIEHYKLKQRTDGSFHASVVNNHQKGYDAIWNGKALYWRNYHREYRITSHDIRIARRWQALGFGRWRSFVAIFGPHIVLEEKGACQHIGRDCRRYAIRFTQKAQGSYPRRKGTAWAGPLSGHTRGRAEKHHRQPLDARGSLWVDRKSGLVLKVNFDGTYRVKLQPHSMTAKLHLAAEFTGQGNPVISIPKKIIVIKREADPLDPFQRKKPFFLLDPPDKKKKKKRR